jgi:hypothetical protein
MPALSRDWFHESFELRVFTSRDETWLAFAATETWLAGPSIDRRLAVLAERLRISPGVT